jgi:hypothetical protein
MLNVCAAHNDWANANFECGLQQIAQSWHPHNHLFFMLFLQCGGLAQSLNKCSRRHRRRPLKSHSSDL